MSTGSTVRLSDVAAVAGVSLSTASKALAGSTRISAATRERVHAAAARLDFRPNALARSFASGRSGTIGVLTHRANSTFGRPVTIGAVLQLGDQHQAALVYDGDVRSGSAMAESIRELQARRIDGLLVIGDGHEHVSPSISHHFEVPVGYVFTASDHPDDAMFLPDNRLAGELATRHLIEGGARRIAHITGPRGSIAVHRRESGMRSVLAEAGLEPVGPVRYGDWARRMGQDQVRELLDSGVEFDAIFCGNDHIGLGAIDVLEAAGRRVPDDVALVGVDNWEGVVVENLEGQRQLTSVDLELSQLGRLAAAGLGSAEQGAGEHLAVPTLVLGGSSRA